MYTKVFLKPKQQHLIICRHAIDTFRRNMYMCAIRYSLLWPFDNFVVCFERYTYYVSHTIKWLFRMLSMVQIWQHFQLWTHMGTGGRGGEGGSPWLEPLFLHPLTTLFYTPYVVTPPLHPPSGN